MANYAPEEETLNSSDHHFSFIGASKSNTPGTMAGPGGRYPIAGRKMKKNSTPKSASINFLMFFLHIPSSLVKIC